MIAVRAGVPHVARLPLGESESFSDHRCGQFDPCLHMSKVSLTWTLNYWTVPDDQAGILRGTTPVSCGFCVLDWVGANVVKHS